MPPETRYAKRGDLNIAYQVVGDGPFDLVYVPGWVSNVELLWEKPKPARLLERLASFSRLILFDKPGTGMSDRVSNDRRRRLLRQLRRACPGHPGRVRDPCRGADARHRDPRRAPHG